MKGGVANALEYNDAVECVYPWSMVLYAQWVFRNDDLVILNHYSVSDDVHYENFTIVDSDFRIYSLPNIFTLSSDQYYCGNIIQDTDGTFWHCYSPSGYNIQVVGFTFKEDYSGINITYSYTFNTSSINVLYAVNGGQLRKFGNRLFIGAYTGKVWVHDIGSNTFTEIAAYTMLNGDNRWGEHFAGPDSSGTVYMLDTMHGSWSSKNKATKTFYTLGRHNIPSGTIAEPGASFSKFVNGCACQAGCSVTDNNGDIYFVVGYYYYIEESGNKVFTNTITVIKISNGVVTTKDIADPSSTAYKFLTMAVDSNRLYILLSGKVLIINKNLDVQETVVMNDSLYDIYTGYFSSDIINGKILYRDYLLDTTTFEITPIVDAPAYISNAYKYTNCKNGFSHNGAAIAALFTYSNDSSSSNNTPQYRLAFPNERQVRGISIE